MSPHRSKSQQLTLKRVNTDEEAATRGSFGVAYLLAKRGNVFTDGELLKECMMIVVEIMFPEKSSACEAVCLSANTMSRRITDIAENLLSQLAEKNEQSEWFSLALDESTDIGDTAQLLIFIRGINVNYEVFEELLGVHSMHGTTTGEDIFKGVENAMKNRNLSWKNLKCITTDGGKKMCDKNKGVVALVSAAVESDGGQKPNILHCIIHQHSLCGKCLDMSEVLEPVMSAVNFIQSREHKHRQLIDFLENIDAHALPNFSAMSWLSCGKVLSRFFELRKVIDNFLNEKNHPLPELKSDNWLWKLSFYCDLTKHMNDLNLKLQGENMFLSNLCNSIKAFRLKIVLFESQLSKKCFAHFNTCQTFSQQTETPFPIDFALNALGALKTNFDSRFSDFDLIADKIKLFQNPFDADIENVAPELQLEIIKLQWNAIYKAKYLNLALIDFYKSLPLDQFPQLHTFARGFFSVFGSTCLCEQTLSKMQDIQNVYWPNLTDDHLKSLLVINTSKFEPQIQKLASGVLQKRTSH